MIKFTTTILLCFILIQGFGQSQGKWSTFLLTQYSNTIYDYTKGNNPWGVGLGLQTFFNTQSKFKPTIELTGDIYLEDDKLYRLNPDGTTPKDDNSINSVINLFVGSSYHPTNRIYFSFLAGPSFISGQTLLGIKPSFGFYFSNTHRWTGKISYINIFNRTKITNEDFGSISLAIGLRLF